MDRKLIGRCGKFCGECRIYIAAHADDPQAVAELAREMGVEPERINCAGCQGPAGTCYNAQCKIAVCLDERGYRYCAQCAEINDCTKYAQNNIEFGGRPKIYSDQLKAWGEERWLRFHVGDDGESSDED
ncbi:MAG: DUF3795 domain-containing protein [bacterium]